MQLNWASERSVHYQRKPVDILRSIEKSVKAPFYSHILFHKCLPALHVTLNSDFWDHWYCSLVRISFLRNCERYELSHNPPTQNKKYKRIKRKLQVFALRTRICINSTTFWSITIRICWVRCMKDFHEKSSLFLALSITHFCCTCFWTQQNWLDEISSKKSRMWNNK